MPQRLGIQSVEVGAVVLAALAEAAQPLPLKDVARRAGMSPGKVHRYLVSLTRSGLAAQDGATGRYGVGPAAIALGLAGLRESDVVRCATESLPRLRDATGETALLALWSRSGPVVIALEESARPVFMNIRVGSILPVLRTATGRVFAAYLGTSEMRALLGREARALCRDGAGRKRYAPARIRTLLAATRTRGIAAVTGELVPGVSAIAAPVFNHRGQVAAVVGLLGRVEDLTADLDSRPARALRAIAADISRRLGFAGRQERKVSAAAD